MSSLVRRLFLKSSCLLAVTLAAGVPAHAITFSKTSVNFGTVVDGTSAQASVTIANNGTTALTINNISQPSAPFSQTNNCPTPTGPPPTTLARGASCIITFTVSPTAPGNLSGSVKVTYNTTGSQIISLRVNAVPPVTLTPTSTSTSPINFGNVSLFNSSPAKTFTLTNNQSTALTINSISTTGDFSQTNNCPTPPQTLASLATCSVSGVFSPTAAGTRTGTLQVVYNASNSPQTEWLTGTGVAVLQLITVAPSPATIGVGKTQQFTATGDYNDGTQKNITSTAKWSSSRTSVATVTNATLTNPAAGGLATGVAVGRTTISASMSGRRGSASLTVSESTLISIAVTPANPSIALGTTEAFTATGTYSNGSTLNITSSVTWASAAPSVATINSSGVASSVKVGSSNISATLGSISNSTLLTVTPAQLSAIVVTPTTASIPAGTQQQFTATGNYTDGSTQNLTASATWSTSPAGVADVIAGLATGNIPGASTTVTATLLGISGSAALTVTSPALNSIAVTPANPSVPLGISQQFAATGTFTDGSTMDLTSQVTWASSTTAASISTGGTGAGLASTLGTGTTQISATLNSVTGSTTLTITPATLATIAVTPAIPTVPAGETDQFAATGTMTDGSIHDITQTANWTSSDGTVATISNTPGMIGLASTLRQGATTITATQSGITGSTTLTVSPAVLLSIALTPSPISLAKGTTQQLTATGKYSDGTTQDLTSSGAWTTSDGTVAAVSTSGLVTGVGVGTATINLQSGTITGSDSSTITAAVLSSIMISPSFTSIPLGTTQQFTATGTYTDSSTQVLTSTVTWQSSNQAAATISGSAPTAGLAQSTGIGSTTITATSGTITGTASLNVNAAALLSIAISPTAPTIALGTSQAFTATGAYTDGTTPDITANVTWNTSDANVAVVSTAVGSHGVFVSSGLGTATISATLGSVTNSTTLTVGSPQVVSIAVTPATVSISVDQTQIYTATATYTDSSMGDITSSVAWSSSSSTVATVNNNTVTAVGVGAATITATYSLATPPITGTSALTVTPAVATHFAISAASAATSGVAFSFTVTAEDTANNSVTGYVGTVHLTSTDGQASLPADYTFTSSDNGVHTFSATLRTAGSQTITSTDTTNVTISGTSGTVAVAPGPATRYVVSAPSGATAGNAFTFTVTAEDAANNIATNYAGTAIFTSSDLQTSVPANYTFTSADAGVHTFSATLKTAGSQTLTASDTSNPAITGTSGAIKVAGGAATHYSFSGTSTATAGLPFLFTLTVQDAFNNTATSYTGMVHFTSSDSQANLPADYTFLTMDNGAHTFLGTLDTVGSQNITATDTVSPSIKGALNAISVSAGAVTHFVVSAPSTATSGVALNFTATAEDLFGNKATSYVGTAGVTTSDTQASAPTPYTFTSADAGSHTFTLTLVTPGGETVTLTDLSNPSITGTSNPITVTVPILPALGVTKSHTGTFAQGQTGTYTIIVSNVGSLPTAGSPVTVTDIVPTGLSLAGISGTNWTCTATIDSCTRSDVLAPAGSYDPITVTVSVASNAPSSVTNQATVSGGGQTGTSSASDVTAISNTAPTANAGLPQLVNVGSVVQLNGGGSSDPDGDTLAYSWVLTPPAGSSAALSNPNIPNPTFTADIFGVYNATLTVTDSAGNSSVAVTSVTTNNTTPVANAVASTNAVVGQLVTLNGSGSTDQDHDPLSFQWSFYALPPTSTLTNTSIANPASAIASFTPDVYGSYGIQLVVTDLAGNSSTAQITVLPNAVPVANAGPAQSFTTVPTTIQLNGTGSTDVDGDALTYQWAIVGAPTGSQSMLSNAAVVNPSFVADTIGTYIVQLTVTDAAGNSNSATTTITGNTIPVANAGPAQSFSSVPTTINLNGGGSSDADGDTLTYSWAFTTVPAGSTATLTNGSTATPSFVADVVGTYVVQLTVADSAGYKNSSTVMITPQTPPIANAGPSQNGVFVGSTVTLDGTASYDPDGDTITYSWSLLSSPSGSTVTALTNPTSAHPTFVPDQAGPYVAQLIVNDGVQNSVPATVTTTAVYPNIITVSLTTSSLETYSSTTGNVHISSPAGPSGQVINLSSNDSTLATVPVNVTIAAGLQDASFVATTGNNNGSATITGFANGFQNGTATLGVAARSMTLSLSSSLVGVGRSIPGTLVFNDNAPACNANNPASFLVTLASAKQTSATITPTSVTIPCGTAVSSTSTPVTVSGIVSDTASFTANATGYSQATAAVTITSSTLNLADVIVAPGQTLALPVALSQPAPTGGVTVTLATANSTIAAMVTPTVTIPAGQTAPTTPAQILGVALGKTTVTGSATGFAPDTRNVNVTLTLTFSPASQSVLTFNTANLLLNLSAPATTGGFTANLNVDDTTKATVPATVFFPAGATSQTVTVTGVAVGTTTLRATATDVTEGDAAITVNPAPAMTLTSAVTVGNNLETTLGGSLAVAAPAGNLNVTLTSSAPGNVLLSPDAVTPGSPSITVQVAAGSTGIPTVYVQGMGSAGTATVTAQATGYANGTSLVTLAPSGFVLIGQCLGCGNFSTTTFASPSGLSVSTAVLNSSLAYVTSEPLRPGAGPVNVTVTSGTTNTGTITTSPVTFNTDQSSESTTFQPANVGTSLITINTPAGYTTPSQNQSLTITVTGPPISLSGTTVGNSLQTTIGVSLGAASPAPGRSITITSGDPTKVVLSTSPTVLGTVVGGVNSVSVPVAAGGTTSSTPIYAQALVGSGTVTLTASTAGYTTTTSTITLAASGFANMSQCFGCGAFTTTSLSTDTPLAGAYSVYLDSNSNVVSSQALRPGVGPVSINLTSSNPATGTITVSPVAINTNQNVSTPATAFHPVATGTTTISINTPAGFSTPNNFQSYVVTVNTPTMSVSSTTIGNNLQAQIGASLQVGAPAGNVTITVTSGDPTKLLLSTSPTTLGTVVNGVNSVPLIVFAGSTSSSTPVYAQALAGSGTVTVTASAPGYASTAGTITLVPSGFANMSQCFGCGGFTTTTFSADTPLAGIYSVFLDPTTLNVQNTQVLRPGVGPITINLTNSNATVGTLTVTSVTINSNQNESTTTAFHPLNAGTTTIGVGSTPAGFTTPSNFQSYTVTVTAPTMSVSSTTVGNSLQVQIGASLSVAAPSATSITITSGDPTKVLLSTSPTTLGTIVAGVNSVNLPVTAGSGSSATPVYVQALAGSGTVTLTASTPGYTTTTGTITLAPSGFANMSQCFGCGGFTTTSFSPNTPLAGIYSVFLDPTTLNVQNTQVLRPGVGPITINLTNSNATVGTLTVTSFTINTNQNESATTAFQPLAGGTTTIAIASTPSGFSTPSNFQSYTVTVTAPNLSVSAVTVGMNMETTGGAALGQADPNPVTLTLSVPNNGMVLLSTDPAKLGTSSLSFNLAANSTSIPTYYVQGVGTAPGTVQITASALGFNTATANITVDPSGFAISGLGSSFNTTTTSAATTLTIIPAVLDPTTLNVIGTQSLLPGLTNTLVNVTSSNTAVGTISVSPVIFNGQDVPNSKTTSFVPVGVGSSIISVISPAGFSQASNGNFITANVTQ